MQAYIITEKQNVNSIREGYAIEAKSLKAAKTHASKNQVFQGTVLTIEAANGGLIAYKENGKWN